MSDFLSVHDLPGGVVPRLGVSVWCDHEVGVGDRRVGQRCSVVRGAVLFTQLVDGTPIESTRGTGRNTGRIEPFTAVVSAQIALRHMPELGVELRCGVRARPFAIATANTLVRVDADDTVLILVHRRCGAHLDADWVVTVVARDRRVVREDLRGKSVSIDAPGSSGVFHDATPVDPDRCVVFVFARDLTCFASVAQSLVEVEAKFAAHDVLALSS